MNSQQLEDLIKDFYAARIMSGASGELAEESHMLLLLSALSYSPLSLSLQNSSAFLVDPVLPVLHIVA